MLNIVSNVFYQTQYEMIETTSMEYESTQYSV